MHPLATGTRPPLSTVHPLLLLAFLTGGCGWSVGRGPSAQWSLGAIRGATVEPGLQRQLTQQLEIARSRRQVSSGPQLNVVVDRMQHVSTASQDRVVAFRAELKVTATLSDRDSCTVQSTATQVWVASEVGGASEIERQHAVDSVVEQVSVQIVDALLARPECR